MQVGRDQKSQQSEGGDVLYILKDGIMKNITWAIQSTLVSKSQQLEFLTAVQDNGYDWCEVPMLPFAEELPEIPVTEQDENVVFYGSTTLTKLVGEGDWNPGVWLNDKFNHKWLNEHNADYMLNYDCEYMKLKDLDETKFGDVVFVRPVDDLKAFSGQAFDKDDIHRWRDKLQMAGLDEFSDIEIVVSGPKNILKEYRCFYVDGKMSDISQYRSNGWLISQHIQYNDPLYNEFEDFLKDFKPPAPVCCVDICTLEGSNNLYVIEVNCMNSSGFYKHNIDKLVHDVSEYQLISTNYE